MKGRIFYCYFLLCVCLAGVSFTSQAQTITTTFTSTTLCSAGTVTVTFTTTGSFSATNQFTAQLSDASGSFSGSIAVGTTTTGGTITASIPASVPVGSGYKIRVVSSAPFRIGSTGAGTLTVGSRPSAPSVSIPSPICSGDTPPVLSATPSGGGSLRWYGTNAISGSPTLSAPVATNVAPGATYYVSQVVGGCESERSAIVVSVKSRPSAPATNPVSYCVGQTPSPLSAQVSSGGTLNWYGTNATGGTATATQLPQVSTVGSQTYYVSQTVNGCEGPRAGLIVTTNAYPAAPTLTTTTTATYCEGVTPQPLSATGQNLRWYGTNATGGTPSSTPSSVNTNQPGITNYYVTQTVNNCESARLAIPVEVKDTPNAPATTAAPDYCLNQTPVAALVATAASGATLNWYGTNATGGTATSVATVPATNVANTSTYYVSQTLNGCEGPRAPIRVLTKPRPLQPGVTSPIITCLNRTAPDLATFVTLVSGATSNWYGTNQVGGTASPTPPVPTVAATGSVIYYVSQTLNGCEGGRIGITVTTNPIPVAPSVDAAGPYCEGQTVPALSATGQSLRWYGTNATGGTGSTQATVPASNAVGTQTYYVTQTVSSCESERASVQIRIKDTPDRPGTSSLEFCQNSSAPALTASLVSGASPNWYGTSQTGGSASSSAPAITSNNVGTTVYYVSQTLDGCEGPRASLNVRVKPTPGQPGVSPIAFCNNGPAQPLTASGERLKWFDTADNPLGGAPTPDTRSVGVQTFKVSQTNGENCEGPKATLTVTINALPGQPGVTNLTYCQAQRDQPQQNIQPLTANGQNLRWYNTDGNAFGNAPTPSIDRTGTQAYNVSQTVNNCEGPRATLLVTVNTAPLPVVPKTLYTFCVNEKATPLQATAEVGGSLRWINPYDQTLTEAPVPPTLNTNIVPEGDPFYVYQIGANGCTSARTTIRVVVNTVPTLSLTTLTPNVNLGQRAQIRLRFTSSGPYSYTLSDNVTGTSLTTDTTISVLPRGNTTYQIINVNNGCGTGLPGNPATAIVTVRIPTIQTGTLNSSTICAGTSIVVPFTTGGSFNSGNVFQTELVSVADTSRKVILNASTAGSPITAPIPTTLAGGQYLVRVRATNPEIGIIGSNSPSTLTIRALASGSLAGTQSIYEGTPANLTLTLGGDGPWSVVYADSIRSYSTTSSVSPLVVEARPARTTTYRLTSVSNNCGTGAVSGTARVTVLPLLALDDNPLDPLVKAYPVPTGPTLTVELDLPLTRNPAVLSLTDLRGRPVLQTTTRTRRTELDMSSQPSGLYILRIQVGDRQTVRKLLKQ